MDPDPSGQPPNRVTFAPSTEHVSWEPNLAGLRSSERDAFHFILEFLEQEETSASDKLRFLRAVDVLSSAVRAQASSTMNDYLPKTVLAKKIETVILEEVGEVLTTNVLQQAMLCIVALSQVDPPLYLAQKLDLVNAGVSRVFSLRLMVPSLDRKESASLYLQTTQALDDMLLALVMDGLDPNMVTLQKMLEIILPWLTLSEKEQEQTRAACTISHMLRFICNFPKLLHVEEFSIHGRLMGTLGIFCMSHSYSVSVGASEGLHYLFKVLVLHRSMTHKTEMMLKDLQKHFRGECLAYIQDLTMFFRKYLTPKERADVVMVLMEAMAGVSENGISAASRILKMILKSLMPEIGKVPEIVQYIYRHLNHVAETTAQATMRKLLQQLAQAYTDDVILTLFEMEAMSQRWSCQPWEILASCPQSYEVIMGHLHHRLTQRLKPRDPEPSDRTLISPLIATRAIHELLLESSRQTEVQMLFPQLWVALLSQVSFLVSEGGVEPAQDPQHVTERMDLISSTVKALKTLLHSTGYGDHVSYVQRLGGWELLTSPERHYEGVTVLARAMVIKNCWHSRPVFSLIVETLREVDYRDGFPAFVFMTELLQCPGVAAAVDDATVRTLAPWFQHEEPRTVKRLLRMVETFAQHGNMARQLRLLQPYVLRCCYSLDSDIVGETFLVLRSVAWHLSWEQSPSFLQQLTLALGPFFEKESDHLRWAAFEIYETLLAKATRALPVFPLKHQVLSWLVLLVLHLADRNVGVAQICRSALCHTAIILDMLRLHAVFAERDMWVILRALLEQEAGKALRLLKQCVALFQSPQAPIRQAAVWFAGQIIQTRDTDEAREIEEAYTALWSMREDPDPMVSCLATQTLYVLEVKEKLPIKTPTCCFCGRRL